MRRAARTDENQTDIVKALRALCGPDAVESLAAVGKGVPDLLVGFQGRNILLEVKRPLGPRGGKDGRKLTPDQVIWHANWRGQVAVVRSVDEAVKAVLERK